MFRGGTLGTLGGSSPSGPALFFKNGYYMEIQWKYDEDHPLRVVTLCSGYDSQLMAIRNLGIPYECVGWSEIDTYAIRAHDAVFPEWKDRNLGDMTKIDWGKVGDFDLLFYSTPCTDFSNAGKQAGGEEGSGTRSSILWYTRHAIIEKRPKYLVMENVKALVSNKFRPLFLKWCDELTGYGYTNFMQVLNAKDYGVPQNRERIFVVSILGDAWFTFPQPRELTLRLKDLLEDKVAEKYYLSQDKVDKFIAELGEDRLEAIENGDRGSLGKGDDFQFEGFANPGVWNDKYGIADNPAYKH